MQEVDRQMQTNKQFKEFVQVRKFLGNFGNGEIG